MQLFDFHIPIQHDFDAFAFDLNLLALNGFLHFSQFREFFEFLKHNFLYYCFKLLSIASLTRVSASLFSTRGTWVKVTFENPACRFFALRNRACSSAFLTL